MSVARSDYERDPAAIYARSFAIVRAEARLDHLPAEAHDVAVRIAHACGMPDVTDDLIVSPGAVEAGQSALAGGAPVLVDAMMVSHGVIRSRLPAGNEVVCTLNDERTASLAAELRTTRSAAQVELWGERLGGAVVAIGNAPTALFRLLELVAGGAPPPALVVGMAVGFVGAAESKEALIASGLSHVVVRGRRGGSAMAAAAVNALGGVPGRDETAWRHSDASPPDRPNTDRSDERGAVLDGTPPPLLVVGTDAGGRVGARDRWAVMNCDAVFGPRRLLDRSDAARADLRPWPAPFGEGVNEIERRRGAGERVGVLASGDPMHYGVGATLAARMGPDALDVRPAPSAFSLAAARLGWALERTACHSLHGGGRVGRDVATLDQIVAPGRRVLALTTDGDTAREVAGWLTERGFGTSTLTVLERMGAADERRRTARADAFDLDAIDPLNTLAIECVAAPDATWHPLVPGLPDDAFDHDGQITKAEARALTVARLAPRPGATLWDIGAGSGSVGVEWLRLSPGGGVRAIEPREDRREAIARNYRRFGLRVRIEASDFATFLTARAHDDAPPDAVFVGGGLSDGAGEAAWRALAPGGIIGANAVTLEGEAVLAALHAEHGGTLTRIAVHRAEAVGPFRGWRPAMPVTLWSAVKGAA